MNVPRRSTPPSTKPVGGGRTWRPAMVYLTIALALAAGVIVSLWVSSDSPTELARNHQRQAEFPEMLEPGSISDNPVRIPEGVDPQAPLSMRVLRQIGYESMPTISEWIQRLREAGINTGIAAFNPPGTRPNLVGLAVPKDFVLPKGYIRHHQTTDDGQRIEAILMFDPDHRLLGANNQPIALPKDRIVTAELAPPGFPIRKIVLPEPIDPGAR